MATLFFSYSHKDESLRDQLAVHLAMLKRQGLIEAWHDRRIRAGDEFDRTIDEWLERADVILLLVSPDFLASQYCYDVEVQRAMERHHQRAARVIPVILRPCDWKNALFAKLQAAPKDGKPVTSWANRDAAFLDIARQIRLALEVETTAARASDPSQETGIASRSRRARKRNEAKQTAATESSSEHVNQKDADPKRAQRVVIMIHGIRDAARWQKGFAEVLADSGFVPIAFDYGWFSVIPFLFWRFRKKKIDWFVEKYTQVKRERPEAEISIVGHSFGTYLIARAMEIHAPLIKFRRVLLCGSIVRPDYSWTQMVLRKQVEEVLNDYGALDTWAALAGWVVKDAGPSGRIGFRDDARGRVDQRYHPEWGHSQYFYRLNYSERWVRFLGGEPFEDGELQAPRRVPVLVRAAAAVLIALGLFLGVNSYWQGSRRTISGSPPTNPYAEPPSGYFSLKSQMTGLCMSISRDLGGLLVQSQCVGGPYQVWTVRPTGYDKRYYLLTKDSVNSSPVECLEANAEPPLDRMSLRALRPGAESQYWGFLELWRGHYTILSIERRAVIDVPNGSSEDGL
jgi:pimeloyl-ACP methyl ester carboxylesterase